MSAWRAVEHQLRGRVRKLCSDADAVDDVVQDVFVRVYERRDSLSAPSLRGYLMRSASNAAIDYDRSRRVTSPADDLRDDGLNPEEVECLLREREALYDQRVQPVVEGLSGPHREALDAFCNSENYASVARRLGLAPSTLRSRKDAALRFLRAELTGDLQYKL